MSELPDPSKRKVRSPQRTQQVMEQKIQAHLGNLEINASSQELRRIARAINQTRVQVLLRCELIQPKSNAVETTEKTVTCELRTFIRNLMANTLYVSALRENQYTMERILRWVTLSIEGLHDLETDQIGDIADIECDLNARTKDKIRPLIIGTANQLLLRKEPAMREYILDESDTVKILASEETLMSYLKKAAKELTEAKRGRSKARYKRFYRQLFENLEGGRKVSVNLRGKGGRKDVPLKRIMTMYLHFSYEATRLKATSEDFVSVMSEKALTKFIGNPPEEGMGREKMLEIETRIAKMIDSSKTSAKGFDPILSGTLVYCYHEAMRNEESKSDQGYTGGKQEEEEEEE